MPDTKFSDAAKVLHGYALAVEASGTSPETAARVMRESAEILTDAQEVADRLQRAENQIVRLNYAPATGYVIEHAEGGRWRTMDTLGMPDWTDDINKALCVTLREHADSYSGEDPEDVRIMHVTGDRCLVDVTRERRLAVLGARTTIETLAHMYRGADPACPGDMPVWDVAMPAVIIEQDDERQRQRQLAAIAEAADYLEELHLAHRNVRPGQPTLVQFSPDIEHYTEGP